MSFWNEAAKAPHVEAPGFSDLPANVWFGGTSTTAENGGARPKLNEVEFNDNIAHKLSFGIIVDSGEKGKSEAGHKGRFCFVEAWVEPNPESDEAENLISGRLIGLLNALYAPGIAHDEKDKAVRGAARWAETMKQLEKIAETEGLTLDEYEDNKGLYIAAVANADLQANSHRLLFKTMERKDKKDPSKKFLKVGSFEDAIEANEIKRKVVSLDENPAAREF